MKKILLLALILILVSLEDFAQITFQKSYGISYGAGNAGTNEVCIMQTYDGGYCLAGTINANNGDAYLMKLNASGDTLWTKTFGGNFDDVIYYALQTPDSGFLLAGQTRSFSMGQSDAYLIKTNKNGNLIWSKNYGGFDFDWFNSIQPTNDGNFIACGTTFTFGAGIEDVYLVKINPSGNILWTKTLGGSSWERGTFAEQTFDGGFIITGYTKSFTAASGQIYLLKTDSLGLPIWSKIFGGVMGEEAYCVKQCSDSGYIVTGYTNSFGTGGQEVFLIKTSPSGNLTWMKTYGGAVSDQGYSLEQTSDNGFIIFGRSSSFGTGSMSDYLIKTNSTGNVLWSKVYPTVICNGHSVHQTNDGGYIIASNPNSFNVIKTDSLGNIGCNEINASTIVNTVSPVILSGVSTGSGGVANNSATIARYTSITIDTLCFSTSIIDNFPKIEQIKINPNPFTDKLNFSTNENNQMELIIYDIASRKIVQQKFTNSVTLNTEQLAKGIYVYEVRDRNGLCKKGKVVKD